jgi:acylphosphatase
MSNTTLHVIITGRVQGVGYRDFVQREARARNVTGWARNRHDGSVEAIVSGHTESVQELLAALHRGPPAARVAEVRSEPADAEALEGAEPGFVIRPTA